MLDATPPPPSLLLSRAPQVALERILSENEGYKHEIDSVVMGACARSFREKTKLAVLDTVRHPNGSLSFVAMLKERWNEKKRLLETVDGHDNARNTGRFPDERPLVTSIENFFDEVKYICKLEKKKKANPFVYCR